MRILVIEDDTKLQSFIKESLEAELYAVDAASDGETGSYLARTNDYDLIILDLMLPEKDGHEVCEEIRSEGKTMPILVLSAQSDTAHKTNLLNSGADDYLTKPFALTELTARVRALLRRPTAIVGDVLTIGGIVLDTKKSTVHKGDEEIKLSRKEFMLLRYLMQNEGTVLTRGMMLEHVWDMSVDIFSNTIEAHILSLRKKLGDTDKGNQLIQTVPGRGYKMTASS